MRRLDWDGFSTPKPPSHGALERWAIFQAQIPFPSGVNVIKLILFDRVFPEWKLNLLHNQQPKI
jgi:hypothetical protein